MGTLEGKVAVITGAASGMGAATARLFASEGARVLVTDMNETKGQEVAEELGANGHTPSLPSEGRQRDFVPMTGTNG